MQVPKLGKWHISFLNKIFPFSFGVKDVLVSNVLAAEEILEDI